MGLFKGHRQVTHPDGTTAAAWYSYVCGHCGQHTSGAIVAEIDLGLGVVKWLECTNCARGSVLNPDRIVYPSSKFGPDLDGLPSEVASAYLEARTCFSVAAYTSCELICRKILMHTAVEKGASEGKSFSEYLTYLESKGYITPPMKGWVDLIRQHGNKAAHLIENPDISRAESTLMFTAELLRLVYEMEHLSTKYQPKP